MQSRQFVLGHSFGLFLPKTPLDEPFVLSARVSGKNNPKQRCNYFDGCFELSLSQILADCDSLHESATNRTKICNISSLRDFAKQNRGKPPCRFCESQNLEKKSNKKFLQKFLLRLAFAKSRIPLNLTDSNLPSKVDSMNRRIYAQKLAILNKQ